MRFLTTFVAIAIAACAHAQYYTKPRAEQVFVKTNLLLIIKSNDLQGALICIDTNLVSIYSNLITAGQIGNIVTSNINENVQTLVFDSLGNFLTNFPHTYADSSGYQSFYATTTRTDAAILRDLRVDRDASIGRNLTVAGTTIGTGNVTAQRNLTVGTNLTVGGTSTVGDSVTIATNLTVGQSALVVSNLAVAGNLSVTGTVSIASTNVITFPGPVHVGDPTRSPSVKPSVIVQYSSADSSNATVQADLGNTNTFASGVSARFLESKWGTIRGALDGAPAEVYPSWRMVYIGSSVGTNPWGTVLTSITPVQSGSALSIPVTKSSTGAWSIPSDAGWTNLYAPSAFGVSYSSGAISLATGGLYRITYAVTSTNVVTGGTDAGFTFFSVMWTNSSSGGYLGFGGASRRHHSTGTFSDFIDWSGARVQALHSGSTLYPGVFLKQTYPGNVACSVSILSLRVFVEWMPLPSTLLNGTSPSAYDYPVPATQFNEANAFNILQ